MRATTQREFSGDLAVAHMIQQDSTEQLPKQHRHQQTLISMRNDGFSKDSVEIGSGLIRWVLKYIQQ